MSTNNPIKIFINKCEVALVTNAFISASLGNYQGMESDLKNIYVKNIRLKNEPMLQFTYRYKTKDISKNYIPKDGLSRLEHYLENGFKVGNCFTTTEDYQYEELPNKKKRIRQLSPTKKLSDSQEHDHAKKRLIPAKNNSYLTALGICDNDGKVFKKSQDKYKQINHYIEILSKLLRELSMDKELQIADMGSGKGYLTFALYDYLTNQLQRKARIQGVEFREDLVDLCNKIAKEAKFNDLEFIQGSISDFRPESLQVMIALHACDTATDDAIAKGIRAGAELIVVAPCCHKQIRRSMEKGQNHTQLDFILRHGILLERQAEMITDAIRALVLEYFGYKTKVFEFISDAHTPKNVMITAIKSKGQTADREQIMRKIKDSLSFFAIDYHHLIQELEL